MFRYLKEKKLDLYLAYQMLPVIFEHPKMDFDSVMTSIHFKEIPKDEIIARIPFLKKKFSEIRRSDNKINETNWIMGEMRKIAVGNIAMRELYELVNN
jgi:glutamyl-tRNA(Gln) amidotransferase subunit E